MYSVPPLSSEEITWMWILHNKGVLHPSCEFQDETERSQTKWPLGFHFTRQALLITQIPDYIWDRIVCQSLIHKLKVPLQCNEPYT